MASSARRLARRVSLQLENVAHGQAAAYNAITVLADHGTSFRAEGTGIWAQIVHIFPIGSPEWQSRHGIAVNGMARL